MLLRVGEPSKAVRSPTGLALVTAMARRVAAGEPVERVVTESDEQLRAAAH